MPSGESVLAEVEGTPGERSGLTVAVTGGDVRDLEILRILRRAGASIRAYRLPPELCRFPVINFGPGTRKGMKNNRGNTILGKGSFSILRLHAPPEPILDTT